MTDHENGGRQRSGSVASTIEDRFDALFAEPRKDAQSSSNDPDTSVEDTFIRILERNQGEYDGVLEDKKGTTVIAFVKKLLSTRNITIACIAVVLVFIGVAVFQNVAENLRSANLRKLVHQTLPEKDNIAAASRKIVEMYFCMERWNTHVDETVGSGQTSYAAEMNGPLEESDNIAGWNGRKYIFIDSIREYPNICGSFFIPETADGRYYYNTITQALNEGAIESKLYDIGNHISDSNTASLELHDVQDSMERLVSVAAKKNGINIPKSEIVIFPPVTIMDSSDIATLPSTPINVGWMFVVDPTIKDVKSILELNNDALNQSKAGLSLSEEADHYSDTAKPVEAIPTTQTGSSLETPVKPTPVLPGLPPLKNPDAEVIKPVPIKPPSPPPEHASQFDPTDISKLLGSPSILKTVRCYLAKEGVVLFNQNCTFSKDGVGTITIAKEGDFSVTITGTGTTRSMKWDSKTVIGTMSSLAGDVWPSPDDKACWMNDSVRICARK